MGKDLILTEEALQTMLNKAVDQSRSKLNLEAIDAAGCDIECIIKYEINIRNGKKNILPLKNWCMQHDLNHRIIFEILRSEGLIEYKDDDTRNCNILTLKGFEVMNGVKPQSSPMITTINSTLFVNDKDPRFDEMMDFIRKHKMFTEAKYNVNIQTKKLNYSRHELDLADKLGVWIK